MGPGTARTQQPWDRYSQDPAALGPGTVACTAIVSSSAGFQLFCIIRAVTPFPALRSPRRDLSSEPTPAGFEMPLS